MEVDGLHLCSRKVSVSDARPDSELGLTVSNILELFPEAQVPEDAHGITIQVNSSRIVGDFFVFLEYYGLHIGVMSIHRSSGAVGLALL